MPSFDITSKVDVQEMDNAVNQASKEIANRFDFRGSKSEIIFDKTQNIIKLTADDNYKMKAVTDIVQNKIAKRGISLESLEMGKVLPAGGNLLKCDIKLIMEIDSDKAKQIVKNIKETKIKVQAQIQQETVRVSGKKRDDLQEIIAHLKTQDFGIPLNYGNFRE